MKKLYISPVMTTVIIDTEQVAVGSNIEIEGDNASANLQDNEYNGVFCTKDNGTSWSNIWD